ncbi:IS5 family transposase [Kitasatospora sp. LaBMicrA B282]|uniref:IS5 family transposase n=1 Tax=Kitasatospora sp. LaBMicrA B282 TaxID=3420949 RepID=UPI003D1403D6
MRRQGATPTGRRPGKWPWRAIVDAIRYVNQTGCQWRALPRDFPPAWTVFGFFSRWHRAGVTYQVMAALSERQRLREGKNPRSVTIVVDSQTIKGDACVGQATRGYDGGRKIDGRKRHVAVDLRGTPVMMMVTPADLQDRDAAREILFRLRLTHPEITLVWADSAYGGQLIDRARTRLRITLKTVSRRGQKGFVLQPKRWVVERSISWLMRSRRYCRDYERTITHAESHLAWTAITLTLARLVKPVPTHWREPAPPPIPTQPKPLRLTGRPLRLHPLAVALAR